LDKTSASVASTPFSRGEKIAVEAGEFVPTENQPATGNDKKILKTEDKIVTQPKTALGIGIAMAVPAMSTTTLNHPLPASLPVQGALTKTEEAPVVASHVPAAELASQAHRAVEAVMTAADRVGAGSRSSVHLQFSVGGSDLSVRVELRAGEVHATFRTDSGELRSALAVEWQSMNGDANRVTRLTEASFVPASTTGGASDSGDGATHQRGTGQRPGADNFENLVFRTPSRAPSKSAAADFRPATVRSNLSLHAFA